MSGPSEIEAYLGLGGNLGDPEAAMAAALRAIDAASSVSVLAVSDVWRTAPWGNPDQPDFLNAVAHVATTLSPRALLDLCLATERALKRERRERWGPRLIDIDILLFDGLSLNEPGLEIPHPRMLERAFVMAPLAEIAPDLVVGDGMRAAEIAAGLGGEGIASLQRVSGWWRGG